MKRIVMQLVCGMLLVALLSPFRAAAAEAGAGDRAAAQDETLLFQMDGIIMDFDQNHLVWKEVDEDGDVIWLYDRNDKSRSLVFDTRGIGLPYPVEIPMARLVGGGVLYAHPRGYSHWMDGGPGWGWDEFWGDPHEINGDFVAYTYGVANVAAKEFRPLPTNNYEFALDLQFDLTADGTVVYTDPLQEMLPYKSLYKSLPDGTLTTYEPSAGYQAYVGALTDGKSILYKALTDDSGWELHVRGADDEVEVLTRNPDPRFDLRVAYQINNGWIAYKEYDAAQDRWLLNVRSPEGVNKQVFATPGGADSASLSIRKMGPDGTVAYKFEDTTHIYSVREGKLRHSFNGAGELEYREHVLEGPGGTTYRFGVWYRVDGGSLYSIRI